MGGVFADAVARKATITAVRLDDALIETVYTAESGKGGRYHLKMSAGDYRITITAPGYESLVIESRRLKPSVESRLNVALTPVTQATGMLENALKTIASTSSEKANGAAAPAHATNGVG